MTDVYPGIDDWDRHVLDLHPGVTLAGVGRDLALSLASPLARSELVVESIARQVADPSTAGWWVGRRMAAWYGVATAGLTDVRELRRLILGARASLALDGSMHRVHAMWSALTGAADLTVRRVRSVSTPSYGYRLTARISWQPSRQWVAQAGAIVARADCDGGQTEACVYVDGALILDGSPVLDVGTLAWALPTV